MTERDWTDMIAGDRMAVDQEFTGRVRESEFTRQEWGLIMTAVEFEIEDPDGDARIVANTEKVPQILPELDNVRTQMQGGGAGGGGGGGQSSGSGGGLFDSIKEGLGLGSNSGVDDERLAAAERLTQEYADELQTHLESQGRWKRVRATARESGGDPS